MDTTHTPPRPPPTAPRGVAEPGILAEITADLGAGHDVEPLLRRFLLPIVSLAGAQAGAVRVFCDETQHLRLVGELGLVPEVADAERLVDRHCGVCGVAADEHRAAWAETPADCKLRGAAPGRGACEQRGRDCSCQKASRCQELAGVHTCVLGDVFDATAGHTPAARQGRPGMSPRWVMCCTVCCMPASGLWSCDRPYEQLRQRT